MRPPSPLLPFLLALLLFSACASTSKAAWVSAQLPAASDRVLWEVTKLSIESAGFKMFTDGFDPVERTAQSAWELDLHPFKGEGFRERVHVSYDPAGPGRVELSVRVEHEINNNIARPTDPSYADWKKAPDNEARAEVILQQIRSRLAGSPPPPR